MLTRPLTRRRFLEGCAGVGALTACAGATATLAFAEGGQIGANARPQSTQVHTVCQACPHGCGYTAYVVEGQLDKAIGDALNPQSAGTLCARGFGYTQSVYSKSNIKNPQRRKKDGSFQSISWDEALSEIGGKLNSIIKAYGSESAALIYNATSPTTAAYVPRFMQALGSGNIFVDDVTVNINKAAAYTQVLGVPSYTPDYANANLIVLIDTSYADIATPSISASLQTARTNQTPIVAIDARLGTVASFAETWVGVNPGSELALLLAVCNNLITSGRYNKAFVQQNASGFAQWAASISGFTSAWAESITGVESARIDQLTARLVDAAPHVAIEYGNGRIGQASFANSAETARVVCLLNMLLGTLGTKGGALLPFDFSKASFAEVMPAIKDSLSSAGVAEMYPLGAPFGASATEALAMAATRKIKALFAVEANIIYDYASIANVSDALEGVELFVCISQQMTETALVADYVLPVCNYLESASLPLFTSDKSANVAVASPVVDSNTNALSVAEIFQGLAISAGIKSAFNFTLADAAEAQLEAVGLTLEGLKTTGSAQLTQGEVKRIDTWLTPTGKIQCASAACEKAGVSAAPVWVPTTSSSNIAALIAEDMNLGVENKEIALLEGAENDQPTFHLISGVQTVLGEYGYNTAELMDIAEQYDLDSVWINAQVAEMLGIETGDEVFVGNKLAAFPLKAFVTQRIVPTALYVPAGFGHTSPKQKVAYNVGVNPAEFCTPVIETGYGTLCTQEATISLWKEGE